MHTSAFLGVHSPHLQGITTTTPNQPDVIRWSTVPLSSKAAGIVIWSWRVFKFTASSLGDDHVPETTVIIYDLPRRRDDEFITVREVWKPALRDSCKSQASSRAQCAAIFVQFVLEHTSHTYRNFTIHKLGRISTHTHKLMKRKKALVAKKSCFQDIGMTF